MPNSPWRRAQTRPDGDPAAQRPTDERGERARAAGTGEAESVDVRVAGPPPAPVRQTGEPPHGPGVAEDEVATSFPAPPVPRHAQPDGDRAEPFMAPDVADRLRERWREVQSGFVDDPREAVRQADGLAAEALTSLGEGLRRRREALEGGGDTERLRTELRRYRAFLDRLLDG